MHVSEALGARLVSGHETADKPLIGSVTVTGFNVTFPVFVTKYEYVIFVPAAEYEATLADFTIEIAGFCVTGVVLVDGGEVVDPPLGVVPDATAESFTDPLFTSVWVTV